MNLVSPTASAFHNNAPQLTTAYPNKGRHLKNKRSLLNYRALKNNFFQNHNNETFTKNEDDSIVQGDQLQLPKEQRLGQARQSLNSKAQKGQSYNSHLQKRIQQYSFDSTRNTHYDQSPHSNNPSGAFGLSKLLSPRQQGFTIGSSNVKSPAEQRGFRASARVLSKGNFSRVRKNNQQPQMLGKDLNESIERSDYNYNKRALKTNQVTQLVSPSNGLAVSAKHSRQNSDKINFQQIYSARNPGYNGLRHQLSGQESREKLDKVSNKSNYNQMYTQRRRQTNQLSSQLNDNSYQFEKPKQTNSKKNALSYSYSPQRSSQIIQEAPEREERTAIELRESKIDSPLSPQEAIGQFGSDYINDFEHTEMLDYEEIYYLAHKDKKIQPTKIERLVNNGYDDSDGYYKTQPGDQIGYRFQVFEQIGKGAFGQVLKCFDHKEKELVAMKLVKNQKKYYYQAAVEAKLLLLLKEKDPANKECIMKIKDYFVFRNHLCMTFELYSINLYEFIKLYNYQGFQEGLIRRFAIQIMSSLKYLKQCKVIHCDLKPENIMLKQKDKSGIVVADFGSGTVEGEIVYTYIQSRFYRAPDIMLGLFPYTQAIDMWSMGCIMIELFTGFPLFPGTNEREQLQLIIDVIGMPPRSVLLQSQRKHLFPQFKDNAVPAANEVLTQQQKEERLQYIMIKLKDTPDSSFVNFIACCLEWDPVKRLTPEQGLRHQWILKGLPQNVQISKQRGLQLPKQEVPLTTRKSFNQELLQTNRSIKQLINQQQTHQPQTSIQGIGQKFSTNGKAPSKGTNINHKQFLKRLVGN